MHHIVVWAQGDEEMQAWKKKEAAWKVAFKDVFCNILQDKIERRLPDDQKYSLYKESCFKVPGCIFFRFSLTNTLHIANFTAASIIESFRGAVAAMLAARMLTVQSGCCCSDLRFWLCLFLLHC